MSPLFVQSPEFFYPTSVQPVLHTFELTLNSGFTALIGANGGGKSTLLTIIAQKAKAQGNIVYTATQTLEHPDETMCSLLHTYDKTAIEIKSRLAIHENFEAQFETLSEGERKRWQVGAALYVAPDVLLLDEPTNHLDVTTKKLISDALQRFTGITLVVSHDRAFMDRLCTTTLYLEAKTLTRYNTYPTRAIQEHQQIHAAQVKEQHDLNKAIQHMDNTIQATREDIGRNARRLSKRHLDKQDHDAKERINFAIFTGRDKSNTLNHRRLTSRRDHMREQTRHLKKEYATGIIFNAKPVRWLPYTLPATPLQIGEKTLSVDRLTLHEGLRLHIQGDNGTGKSTLMRHIASALQEKELFYLPQEITSDAIKTLLKRITALNAQQKGELFTLVTRMGSDAKGLLQSHSPSPGEVRKLLLGFALMQEFPLLLMDEPTNHLDLVAIEVLEEALQRFQGCLIFTSHDETFADTIATQRYLMS